MSIHHYNNTGKPNKGLPHISKPTRTTKTIMQIFQKPETNENEQDNCHEEDKYSKSTSSSTNNKNLHEA
jgi:hypothetical protein